jgi:hypothetical protein
MTTGGECGWSRKLCSHSLCRMYTCAAASLLLMTISPRHDRPGWFGSHLSRFFFSYLASWRGHGYPARGIPPLHAAVRLVLGNVMYQMDPSETDPATSKKLHRLAFGFLWCLIQNFYILPTREMTLDMIIRKSQRSEKENANLAKWAASQLGLGWEETFPVTYREVLFPEADVATLLGWNCLTEAGRCVARESHDVSAYLYKWCRGASLFETEDGHIGRAMGPVEVGDEVYEVEHCNDCSLVFRAQREGCAEPGRKSVVLLCPCEVVGVGDGLDDRLNDGKFEEELLIC